MVRRILSVVAMSGLLISVALWGLSYTNMIMYRGNRYFINLYGAHIQYLQTGRPWSELPKADKRPLGWRVIPLYDLNTLWKPWYTSATEYWTIHLPLWMPAVLFGGLFCWVYLPIYRLRKRRKRWTLGRCVVCGYDLTGNTSGTCPECGTRVNASADL